MVFAILISFYLIIGIIGYLKLHDFGTIQSTKHLYILVPAPYEPYLHTFSAVGQKIHIFGTIWDKFALYFKN